MVNYQNGKIYKLVNNVDDEIYVGSTCNPLRVRKGGHKRDSKTRPNYKVYKHLNEVGWENVEIILIENYACESKDELHRRERHWIDTLKPSLNKVIPTRTKKEWREENREVILKKKKEYRKSNKEVILQKQKEYAKANKEYCQNYKKEYNQKNKEAISKKQRIKSMCDCGKTLTKISIPRHKKSKNHLFWEKQYNYIFS